MRKLILILMITCISMLNAAALEIFQESAIGIHARFESMRESPMSIDMDEEFPETATISRTFAFPFQNVEPIINQMTWKVFNKQGQYLGNRSELDVSSIETTQPFTFREMQGLTMKVFTQRETDTEILTLDNLDIELRGSGSIDLPQSLSPAFIDAYKVLVDNWDSCYLRSLPIARPKMLIVSHPQLATYQLPFVQWKRAMGFDVYVVNKADLGSTVQEIRDALQVHYQQHRADYLLLLGDTVGTYSIPTNFYPSPEYQENDADDQFYSLLEGDDYFPEMLVGRFSFTSIMEFIVMITKSINYERNPYMGENQNDTAWMTRALAVAGNYAEGTLRPTTPVWMSRWLRERLLDYGYAQVDTVFYPGSYPGTSNITQSINQGVQFISYRGWGDVNGWHYPRFHTPDLDNTSNGPRMPIVYSIVCNTGDFANSVNPSFGEKWMRMGTSASLGGCVAFVGPSDLHTKTRLNNSISTGAYRSVMDYGVRGFGTSVLMGKMELYKNFPNDIAPGQYVPFYFHVYNILSDPSMNMWSLVPGIIEENIIEGGLSFAQSASHILINAPHLEDAIVSGTKDSQNYTYARVIDGSAVLNIDPEQEGDLILTVFKPDWVPLVRTLSPNEDAGIGVVSNSAIGTEIVANETQSIDITVKNYSGSAFNGVSASLAPNPKLQITPLNPSTFDLDPGATHTLQYSITATADNFPGEVIKLQFNTQNPNAEHMFELNVGGAKISMQNHSGILELTGSSQITFQALNTGNVVMQNVSVIVRSRTTAITISEDPIPVGTIAPGNIAEFAATINVQPDLWDGRMIPLTFVFSDDHGYEWTSFYTMVAGSPGTNDPTGPCNYGYFAYDNTDASYDMAPQYDWIEIDPLHGGSANLWLVMDDGVKRVELPFTFMFYGLEYDEITISSNGWASFVHTDESYFNNHYINAALGPNALLAPYWDDLKGMKTGVDSLDYDVFADMRILYWHDEANNRFIIQWNDAYNQATIDAGANASLEKFQIILYPKDGMDGDIVFQYHTVDNPAVNGNYCTVGIEDHLSSDGITYSYGNIYPATAAVLEAGRAICFTTTAPDTYVSNEDVVAEIPLANLRNYPNPFNPSTVIAFESSKATMGSLKIYNTKGQLIKQLYDGSVSAGTNTFIWDGRDNNGTSVSSGIYYYRLQSGESCQTRKMLLMK
ncbi:MAG: C25 family cysteine peptidase [Candidatus Cloacimonetes bacterium]|nr:C25 family cysteine peptidase [Candidatus Cloacimonadota bacterium]